jgi:ferredoxin
LPDFGLILWLIYGRLAAINICKVIDNRVLREIIMKVRIEDSCTACELCVDTCPEVFTMGDEMAEVLVGEVPAEFEEAVQEAADDCPVEAIIVD